MCRVYVNECFSLVLCCWPLMHVLCFLFAGRSANLSFSSWCWCFTFHITNNGITVNIKKVTTPLPFSLALSPSSRLPANIDWWRWLIHHSFHVLSLCSCCLLLLAGLVVKLFSLFLLLVFPIFNSQVYGRTSYSGDALRNHSSRSSLNFSVALRRLQSSENFFTVYTCVISNEIGKRFIS